MCAGSVAVDADCRVGGKKAGKDCKSTTKGGKVTVKCNTAPIRVKAIVCQKGGNG